MQVCLILQKSGPIFLCVAVMCFPLLKTCLWVAEWLQVVERGHHVYCMAGTNVHCCFVASFKQALKEHLLHTGLSLKENKFEEFCFNKRALDPSDFWLLSKYTWQDRKFAMLAKCNLRCCFSVTGNQASNHTCWKVMQLVSVVCRLPCMQCRHSS